MRWVLGVPFALAVGVAVCFGLAHRFIRELERDALRLIGGTP